MPFTLTTIEHLGLKLYSSLPRVIGELISNSWDAEAEKVEITFPEGEINEDSEIRIRDYGNGMNEETIQGKYLPIGRCCRDNGKEETETKHRPIMGRKGIGKLSAFGIANELQMRTMQNGKAICIVLNYEEMQKWPKKNGDKPYEPYVVEKLTGNTKESNGTEIILRQIHRRSPIDEDSIRRDLARKFIIIGSNLKNDKFEVLINGNEVTNDDRRLKESCKKFWDVSTLPRGNVVDTNKGWTVSGWVGIVSKSSQTERGVDIFARGKAAELETMFGLKTTHIQFARAYVVGEINAEFIDKEEDNISTARNMINWESEAGQKLGEWGREVLTYVFKQWLILQQKEKEEKIIKTPDFERWLNSRSPREQKIAKKFVNAISADKDIEPESAGPLLEMIKSNIEFQAFQELVDDVESGADVQTILKLFDEWRIIEAREHLKLSDGRLDIIEQLSKYIDEGALEVKQIQPLFEINGWLINPTWTDVTGQTTYTKLLRKEFEEPKDLEEENRRIDILGYEIGGSVCIVELKRPTKTLSWKDLEQIEHYVTWARSNLCGTGPDSPKYINGLLVVGKLSSDSTVKSRMVHLAGIDIRVETFNDLRERAEKVYGEVEKRLKVIAPEYSRTARKSRKK